MSSVLQQVRNALTSGASLFTDTFGFPFDYSQKSLRLMEDSINKLYPLGHEPMTSTLVMMGFYLGEVLVKNLDGANWGEPQEEGEVNPFTWGIKVPLKSGSPYVAFPIQRVRNFWFDRTDTLYGYFNMLLDMNRGFLDPTKEGTFRGDGYIYKITKKSPSDITGNEDQLRMDVAKKIVLPNQDTE